mmetsp:Transcript_15408/g.31835  ORF Transcript_15408/g.31835 Transcript_15408/m.31835 type:complete len:246 (+) Transcript_15408:151-888(+)
MFGRMMFYTTCNEACTGLEVCCGFMAQVTTSIMPWADKLAPVLLTVFLFVTIPALPLPWLLLFLESVLVVASMLFVLLLVASVSFSSNEFFRLRRTPRRVLFPQEVILLRTRLSQRQLNSMVWINDVESAVGISVFSSHRREVGSSSESSSTSHSSSLSFARASDDISSLAREALLTVKSVDREGETGTLVNSCWIGMVSEIEEGPPRLLRRPSWAQKNNCDMFQSTWNNTMKSHSTITSTKGRG